MNIIHERLKFERTKRGMTQKDFAQVMEMNQGQYSLIEKGENNLTIEKMNLLNKKLKIDLNYLITGQYLRLDFGLDKMDFAQLKRLNTDIFIELESRNTK